jgi:hypothetical protein
MANKTINQLPATTPVAADEVPFWDVGGGITGKATISELVAAEGADASIYTARGVTAQGSIGTSFVKVTGFANDGVAQDATADSANNKITVNTTGAYEVHFDISFSGSGTTTFDFEVYVNGASADLGIQRKLGTGGDVGNSSCARILQIGAGQDVEVYVKADGTGKTITPVYMNLYVHRVR